MARPTTRFLWQGMPLIVAPSILGVTSLRGHASRLGMGRNSQVLRVQSFAVDPWNASGDICRNERISSQSTHCISGSLTSRIGTVDPWSSGRWLGSSEQARRPEFMEFWSMAGLVRAGRGTGVLVDGWARQSRPGDQNSALFHICCFTFDNA